MRVADALKAIKAAIGNVNINSPDQRVDSIADMPEADFSVDRWEGNLHSWSSVVDPLNQPE